jgi:hypothetical protein
MTKTMTMRKVTSKVGTCGICYVLVLAPLYEHMQLCRRG